MKKFLTLLVFIVLCATSYAQQRPANSGTRLPQIVTEGEFSRLPPEIQKIVKDNPQRFIMVWGETNTSNTSTLSERPLDQNNPILTNSDEVSAKQRITRRDLQGLSPEHQAIINANPSTYEIVD